MKFVTAEKHIETKKLYIDQRFAFNVQFNRARIRSTAAKVDAASIAKRPCFLCKENRPPEQKSIDFQGKYELLENPFPIFPEHLTIPTYMHIPQTIMGRFGDMLTLAKALQEYTIFYNGPQCGASAPDHMHFQAGSRRFMPIEEQWQERIGEHLAVEGNARLHLMSDAPRNTLMMIAEEEKDAILLFERIAKTLSMITCAPALKGIPSNLEGEPMLNVLTYYENGQWFTFIFPRTKHRPSCYFAEGEKQLMISPASVDLGGVLITAREQDFQQITVSNIEQILREVCWQDAEINEFKHRLQGDKVTR